MNEELAPEHHERHLAYIFILIIVAIAIPAYLTGSITGAAVVDTFDSNQQIAGTFLVFVVVIALVTVLFHKAHGTEIVEITETPVDHAQQLKDFILEARSAGESKESITRTLIASGWQKKIVLDYVNHLLSGDLTEYPEAVPPVFPHDVDPPEQKVDSAKFNTSKFTTPKIPNRAAASFVKSAAMRGFSKDELKKALVHNGFLKNEAKRLVNHIFKKNKKILKHQHHWREKAVSKSDLKYMHDELAKLSTKENLK